MHSWGQGKSTSSFGKYFSKKVHSLILTAKKAICQVLALTLPNLYFFKNGKGSTNSSPKKALINGGGTSPYIDATFTRLTAATTPVRKSSPLATMVKNSNSHHEDSTTAASTDEKSIIQPVVYNV